MAEKAKSPQTNAEPLRSRHEELLADPEATFKDPQLQQEFLDEHTLLMKKFENLQARIDSGEIDAAGVAMAVLKERVRLAQLHKGRPTS